MFIRSINKINTRNFISLVFIYSAKLICNSNIYIAWNILLSCVILGSNYREQRQTIPINYSDKQVNIMMCQLLFTNYFLSDLKHLKYASVIWLFKEVLSLHIHKNLLTIKVRDIILVIQQRQRRYYINAIVCRT